MKMSSSTLELEKLFDVLNTLYFDGALTMPVITVQSSPAAYGHCTAKKIWVSSTEAKYEINIGAETLDRPYAETAATMCHEMIHLFCLENDLQSTCQNGRYHNKLFKTEAEARDLLISYKRAIGYSVTAPSPVFIQKLTQAGIDFNFEFARQTPLKIKAKRQCKPQNLYQCPQCGQKFKTQKSLHINCADCDCEMPRL